MVKPPIVKLYDKTIELWDEEHGRYVTLSWAMIKAAHDVLSCPTHPIQGVEYRHEAPKPELCKHGLELDAICDDCAEEAGLSRCEQCDEIAFDGRICHSCGMKEI